MPPDNPESAPFYTATSTANNPSWAIPCESSGVLVGAFATVTEGTTGRATLGYHHHRARAGDLLGHGRIKRSAISEKAQEKASFYNFLLLAACSAYQLIYLCALSLPRWGSFASVWDLQPLPMFQVVRGAGCLRAGTAKRVCAR